MSESIKKIFDQSYQPLCNYVATIIKDKHASEDVVQSVFIQLWEKDVLTKLDNPHSYLLRCVKHKSIDYLRGSKRSKELSFDTLPDLQSTEITSITEQDIKPLVSYFAAQLPPKMQRVFLLSRNKQMSYAQISEKLEISIKTVENHMGSALKKLRQLLKEHHYLSMIVMISEIL